ncbi:hypothetical protein J41TS12_13820 [Paenibacillus antibioticophila]|uniref:KAP NTPase domain-containing protein n=1 Tax=Paenibacillus antibioticophila TaxID=1274374 RepID=A0A920CE33_9BACL|nr:P-loop NTPase fold protein [Paenibacillus antibioticophila]GIO36521.1 hypothetical protein J41TS12_13820 [Paenibacillus antibioticophila]
MPKKKKEDHIQLRSTITKALLFTMISLVLFYPFNPKFIVYIAFMGVVWGVLILNYKSGKNLPFFFSAIMFSLANLLALTFMKWAVHRSLHIDWINIALCLAYVCALLILGCICLFKARGKEQAQKDDNHLFTARKYDLDRIKKYIENEEIVGVNGRWGSGKSFLVAELKKQLNESGKYIFIEIDLLSCNLDELQVILLGEMERVLNEHKIVPAHSTKLKRIIQDNAIYHSLYMLLMQDNMSYSEALNGFMQEISKLGKSIVIVYEDIDRITNIDVVKKIFSISEKLASKHIKIIYQYEESNLRKLGLERDYLEKYIPFIVNLTPVNLKEILATLLKDEGIDERILTAKDFDYLAYPIRSNYYLEQALAIRQANSLKMYNFPARKIRSFIKELEINLIEHTEYHQKELKQAVINFYFTKHFLPDLYDLFNLEEGLLDTIKFEYEDRQYTILELISFKKAHQEDSSKGLSSEQIERILESRENKDKLFLLNLFQYELDIQEIKRDFNEIVNESFANIRRKASNEKKDRLLWNLLCNGKSEYTDYEAAARKFIKDVLSKPESKQRDAFENYLKELYGGSLEKRDNRTIFRIGIPTFVSLAQALRVSNASDQDWIKFMHFYFDYTGKEAADMDLIQVLNYFNLSSKEVYLSILKKFNALNIVGNMNKEMGYRRFLKRFLEALSVLGFANTLELWRLDSPNEVALQERDVEDATKYIRIDLLKMQSEIGIEVIKEDLATIVEFINKNIEIVKCEQILATNEPRMSSTMSSKFIHQEEVDRLSELYQNAGKDLFIKELVESYKNNRISAYEVNELVKRNL